jgi:hypothetical protein
LVEATDYAKLGPNELIGISGEALEALAVGNVTSIAVLVDDRHTNREAIEDALSHVMRDWATQDVFTADERQTRRLAVVLVGNHLLQPLQLPRGHWFSADAGGRNIAAAMNVPSEHGVLTKTLANSSAVRSIALMSNPSLLDHLESQDLLGIAFEPLRLGIRSPATIATWIYDCLTKEPRERLHSTTAVAWLRRLGDAALHPKPLFDDPIPVGGVIKGMNVDKLLRRSIGYGSRAVVGAMLLSACVIERSSPSMWSHDEELPRAADELLGIAREHVPDAEHFLSSWIDGRRRFWQAEGFMEG